MPGGLLGDKAQAGWSLGAFALGTGLAGSLAVGLMNSRKEGILAEVYSGLSIFKNK